VFTEPWKKESLMVAPPEVISLMTISKP